MELDYKYVTVRAYKNTKKGEYRDETHIVDQVDCVFKIALSEEENIKFFEDEYIQMFKKHRDCEVVGSISSMYTGKEVSDDPIADAKIEAELFESTTI